MSFVFFVFMIGLALVRADPCKTYSSLPYADLRFVNNLYDSSDDAVSDRFLIPDWYRVADDDMPVTMPAFLSCGTKSPIWLNGTIPHVSSSEVSRTACMVVAGLGCTKKYGINVKNCGTYRVYYLEPTSGSDQGYCFGIGESGTKPSYTPPKAEVKVETVLSPDGLKVFASHCEFDKGPGIELYYQVTWYIDGVYLTAMEPKLFNDLIYIVLDESNMKTLGKKISCSVRARKTPKGPPGLSVKSAELFLGIELLTPFVHIERGQSATIRLRPTVPIGCIPDDDNCILNVAMYTDTKDKCHDVTSSGQSDCGATINTANSTDIIELSIAAEEEEDHDVFSAMFDVVLRTDDYQFHTIWSNYILPLVKVSVTDTTGKDKGACQANNDPHMMTFDQRPYDIQYPGDFILYRHTQYPLQTIRTRCASEGHSLPIDTSSSKVQSRFETCYGKGRPYCIFGVAVQAGKDVFVIDQTKQKKFADFAVCKDSVLDVRKVDTRNYRIYTPIGSLVEVTIDNKNRNRITIHIYPSVRDKNSTEGLCGTLTNACPDDFKMSNGNLFENSKTKTSCNHITGADHRIELDTFSRSWLIDRVPGAVNLFDPSLDDTDLPKWNQGYRRCKCKRNNNIEGINTNINCTANMVSTCARNKWAKKQIETCRIMNGKENTRPKRSLRGHDEQRERYHQRKRKSVSSTMVQMTEAEAEAYCQSSLGNSELFKLCGDVPNINTEHSIQACTMDIMLSNSTEWTDSSRESLQNRCLSELQMNSTLEQNGTAGHPSIAAAIRKIACPGKCSESGECINGTCDCQDGFGGIDCSIDLSIPPYFEELLNNGMCDKQAWECDVAMATGDDFIAEDHLKCKMQPFWIDTEGLTHTEKEEIVTADIQTFMNLFCPLTLTRRKRDTSYQSVIDDVFVEAYNVSLTNDGIHFGDQHTLFIYDSKCQTVELSQGKQVFLLKDGYCFIDNKCMDEYDLNPENVCQMCSPSVSAYTWSQRTIAECSPIEERNYLWVIGPVAGSLTAVAVISVVIWRIKLRKMKKVSDSSLFTDTTRGEQRR